MKPLVVLILGLITTALNAQTNVTPAVDVNLITYKKTTEIEGSISRLTTQQETLISNIELNYAQGVQAAFASNNIDNDAIHKEIKQLREDRDAKIKSVLDDDQYIQYLKMEEKDQATWNGDNYIQAYQY